MWDTIIIKPFISALLFIYDLIGENFGLAIILFTILVKLITHPLTVKQIKSSKALQDMQSDKDWLEVQKKYKNDKDRLAQEQMKMYKEKGISPFASCLPTLISIPGDHWFVSEHHPDDGKRPASIAESGNKTDADFIAILFLPSRA